jgi:hypothetical protein
MEEKLQIQKVNTWDQLLMKKPQNLGAGRTYVAMPEIRHIKYVFAGDLLFGSIIIWGNECLAYTH